MVMPTRNLGIGDLCWRYLFPKKDGILSNWTKTVKDVDINKRTLGSYKHVFLAQIHLKYLHRWPILVICCLKLYQSWRIFSSSPYWNTLFFWDSKLPPKIGGFRIRCLGCQFHLWKWPSSGSCSRYGLVNGAPLKSLPDHLPILKLTPSYDSN